MSAGSIAAQLRNSPVLRYEQGGSIDTTQEAVKLLADGCMSVTRHTSLTTFDWSVIDCEISRHFLGYLGLGHITGDKLGTEGARPWRESLDNLNRQSSCKPNNPLQMPDAIQ